MRSIISSSRGSTLTDDRKSVVSGHSSNASTLVQESGKIGFPLRKFTAGVGRPGLAREAREAVRNVITTANPTRLPPMSSPLNYERFITERNIQLENDPQRELLLFPRDDVEEILVHPEHSTVVPTVTTDDIGKAQWLLTKEAIGFFSSDYHTVCFNYGKFCGDYNKINQGSTLDGSATLASLVFESDLALEEEKAFDEGFLLTDIVKEGYVLIVKSDPTLLTNLKSAKKRYCVLRRQEGGDIVVEIRKTASDLPKRPPMKVNSAQLRSTKKGKTILEIEPFIEDPEKADQVKPLTIVSEDMEEINSWLLNVNRAIALSTKLDSISICSEKLDRSVGKGSDTQPDTMSTTSEDSSASRDTMLWKGRGNAARVLHPPIVERHNMFSLYYKLAPLLDPKTDRTRSRWNCTPEGHATLNSTKCLDVSRVSIAAPGQPCRFSVKFKGLTLKLPIGGGLMQQIEPFYVSIFIFDAHAGRRLSEEFHVDVSGARTKELNGNAHDPVSTCLALATNPNINQALFTVAAPTGNMWLICRVDRALSADTSGDVYMKSSPDPKVVQKTQKTIQSSAVRLSNFRQRFAWTARPLFVESKNGADASCLQLYRCENSRLTESDLQKALNDFSRIERGKTVIPNATAFLSVDLNACPSDFNCRINSSFLPLRPFALTDGEQPVFDLQSFGDVVLDPHTELLNLLYIYPLSLKYDSQKLFSKARNITCTVKFVRGDDKVANKAVVDRLAPHGPFVSHAACAVQHHQQVPTFGDEIKMRLPLSLSASDHLLFSFTHVSISGQTAVRSPENHETPIGYAWLPLVWKKDRLVMEADEQDFALPVAVDLPSGYLRSKPHGASKEDTEIRWVDQRPLFRFRLRLVSSVFTTEGKLQSFFQACQKLESRGIVGDATDQVKASKETQGDSSEPARSCSPLARYASFNAEHPIVDDLTKRTESLVDVPIEKLLPFLPVLLSRLFALLPHAPSDVLALSTMSSVISICDRCISAGRKSLLRTFIRLHFVAGEEGDETVHSSICRFLPAVIRLAQSVEDYAKVFRQLWFLLDLASKSLAQTIIHRSLYKVVRKERVSAEVLETMGSMIETIVLQVVAQHRELPDDCREANVAVSHFIRGCLSFLDRGAVFQWIHFVVKCYDESDAKVLREYKNTLLTVICQHEHWLPLNLPVLLDSNSQIQRINYQSVQQEAISTTGGGFVTRFLNQLFQTTPTAEVVESNRYGGCSEEWYLSDAFAMRHFLVGLLFQELKACLRDPREFRRQPFVILRNLLAKHSFDKRYKDAFMQQRIAILYVPVVRFAVDILHELQSVIEEQRDAPGLRTLVRPFECRESPSSPTPKSPSPIDTPLPEKLDSEEVMDLLISVMYVVHRLPKRILSAVWLEADGARALPILNLLEIAAQVFSYRGRDHAVAVTTKKKRNAVGLHLMAHASSRLNSLADLNISGVTDSGRDDDASLPFAVLQMLNLSQEVALIILDAVQTLARTFAVKYSRTISVGEKHDIFVKLLSLHLGFLADNWPESVRLHAIAAIAVFVNLYRSTLFEGGPLDALSVLIEHVLLQMASRLPSIQNAAAALLQLILRSGYEAVQTQLANQAMALSVLPSSSASETRHLSPAERLGRPGAQTGVALARLLGTQSALSSSGRLEKGLGALENLVVVDARKATIFDKAVLELLKQMRGVMLATVALKDAAQDSFRLAELHIQLANSYRGSAALRSAWFDTLAQVHSADNWHSEAAVCHAHSVAIIAKELMEKGELQLDWSIFDWISKEICEEEKGVGKERTVQPAGFTLENLVHKIEKTVGSLTLAERYEAIGPLYGLVLLPLHRKCVFNSLVSIHADLQQTYSRAAEVKLSGKRHLGSYFRVRFIGDAFEADNDTEWIYREAGLTSLAEVSLRMQDTWRAKGCENVQIASESETSFGGTANTAFLQITHVEPFLAEGQRAKDFWSHTNIRKFVYETPIMEDCVNSSEGDISIIGQALKRVCLEVTDQFPCSRRRLRVISRTEEVFTPLRFACQKLATKAEQIRVSLAAPSEGRPLDIKGLQLLLQGAVLPTVNAGPLAYAEAFTQADQKKRYGEEGVAQLVESFRDLMSACESALNVNRTVVGADQQKYHEVLVSSFDAMHERLLLFFGHSLRPLPEDERKSVLPISAIHILDSIGGVHT